MSGALPSQLGKLSQLGSVGLPSNSFSGVIPSQLGRLTSWKYSPLNLANMDLTGTVPSQLGCLTAITSVFLGGNSLTGESPAGAFFGGMAGATVTVAPTRQSSVADPPLPPPLKQQAAYRQSSSGCLQSPRPFRSTQTTSPGRFPRRSVNSRGSTGS